MAIKPTPPSPARDKVRATVPKLIDLTEKVVYGDVWERPQLSKRDRSLITCAALVALNRTEQLKGHLERALNNGVTPEEIGELITHLAFYGGWPVAMSGATGRQGRARELQEVVLARVRQPRTPEVARGLAARAPGAVVDGADTPEAGRTRRD